MLRRNRGAVLTLVEVILVQHKAEHIVAREVLGQHDVLVDEVDGVVQVVVLKVLASGGIAGKVQRGDKGA